MPFKHPRLTILVITALTLLTIGLAGCSLYLANGSSYPIKPNKVALTDTQIKKSLNTKLITTRQDTQKSATAKYKAAAESDTYTLTHPYVKVNPYGTSPLSALVSFKSSTAEKITYTVVGKTDKTSITNTVKGGYTKSHQVPVVGLYADTNNTVKITATTKNGQTQTTTLKMQTGALPKYIKNATITTKNVNKSKMSIGKNQLTVPRSNHLPLTLTVPCGGMIPTIHSTPSSSGPTGIS